MSYHHAQEHMHVYMLGNKHVHRQTMLFALILSYLCIYSCVQKRSRVYASAYVCIRWTYACLNKWIYVPQCARTYACIHARRQTCTQIRTAICINIYEHMHFNARERMHVYMLESHAWTYTHPSMHATIDEQIDQRAWKALKKSTKMNIGAHI